MACGCGAKNTNPNTLAVNQNVMAPADEGNGQGEVTVTWISSQIGWFTGDSGRKYKSYGVGTKIDHFLEGDRSTFEGLGYIAQA